MKIKKPLLLPLLAAVVLPFVYVLPTFARAPILPADDSGAACKPIVQISHTHLNFFEETCMVFRLWQGGWVREMGNPCAAPSEE